MTGMGMIYPDPTSKRSFNVFEDMVGRNANGSGSEQNYVTMSKVLYLTAFSFTKITQQQDQFSWKQRSYRANNYKIA